MQPSWSGAIQPGTEVLHAQLHVPQAGGKWHTFEITVKGSQLTVVLNGTKTVDIQDSKFASGPVALQYGSGVVKFRKVELRPL